MGPVSAENALVALDDRPIDRAADPPHVHTAPASQARHDEREEKGEEPRGSNRMANGALTVRDVGPGSRLNLDTQPHSVRRPGYSLGRAFGAAC